MVSPILSISVVQRTIAHLVVTHVFNFTIEGSLVVVYLLRCPLRFVKCFSATYLNVLKTENPLCTPLVGWEIRI